MTNGRVIETHDYGHDVGYLHRGDYAWYLAERFHLLSPNRQPPTKRIGRYLDGEEEREGLYR